MFLRAAVVSLIAVALPALAHDEADERLKRWADVIAQLRAASTSPQVCRGLSELSLELPPTAVLSSLAFDRKSGLWSVTLSHGTQADSQATIAPLVKHGLCVDPQTSAKSASCTASVQPAPPLRTPPPGEAESTKPFEPVPLNSGQQKEAFGMNVLVSASPAFDVELTSFAAAQQLRGVSWARGPAIPSGPVERFEVTAQGTGSFIRVAGLLCAFSQWGPLMSVDAFELNRPRIRNGEWVVDFAVTTSTWRYVRELASTPIRFPYPHPRRLEGDEVDFVRTRSPFGPPAPIYAGSTRPVTGRECRDRNPTQPTADDELDSYAVAFMSDRCVMLVDEFGGCHELAMNSRMGQFKLSRIEPNALTLVTFTQGLDSRPLRHAVSMRTGTPKPPPAWFCPTK